MFGLAKKARGVLGVLAASLAMLSPAQIVLADDGSHQDVLWVLRGDGLLRLDPVDLGRVVSRIEAENVVAAAVDDLRQGLWISTGKRQYHYSLEGELRVELGSREDGVASVGRIAVNAEDGALWMLDQRTLLSVGPDGTLVGSQVLPQVAQHLLVDSSSRLLWVIGREQATAYDVVQGLRLQSLSRPTLDPIVSAALDPLHGELWIATEFAIERHSSAGSYIESYPIQGVRTLVHGGSDSFWAVGREGLAEIGLDGEVRSVTASFHGMSELIDLAVKGETIWATDGARVARINTSGRLLALSPDLGPIKGLVFSPADNVAPKLSFVDPISGQTVTATKPRLRLAFEDVGIGPDTSTLEVVLLESEVDIECSVARGTATCTPATPISSGSWTAEASVADRAGNRSLPARVTFTLDADGEGSMPGGAPNAPYPTQTTLNPTADTYIAFTSKNTNFGSDEAIVVGLSDRGLALFDVESVIPSIVTLNSATLRLHIEANNGSWGDGALVGAHRVTTAWTEGGATWNCPDDTNPGNTEPDCSQGWGGGDYVATATDSVFHHGATTGWVEYDVTADVSAMISGTSNLGWIIVRTGESLGSVDYASRESSSGNFPELVLDYIADDSDPPTISIDSPTEGEAVATAQPTISISYSDPASGIDESSLDVQINGASSQASCTTTPTTATCQPIANLPEGANSVAATVADKAGNVSTQATVNFTVDTVAPVITVTYPPDGLLTNVPQLTSTGSLSETATLTLSGQSVTVDPGLTFAHQLILVEGANALAYVATDPAGNQGSVVVNVTLDSIAPNAVERSLVSVGAVSGGNTTVQGSAGAAEAGTTLVATNFRTNDSDTTQVAPNGSFTVTVPAQARDVISLVLTDPASNSSVPTNVVVPTDQLPAPPPDPTPSPIDPTVPSDIARDTAFLYEGPTPIQTGVAAGTMDARHVSVLRGQVFDRDGNPLPSVTVSILDRPEFGQTLTRADGKYDLVVNGGDLVTLRFERPDLLTAQRAIDAHWRDYVVVEDVALIPADDEATTILLGQPVYQVVRGSVETDADGNRQSTIIVPSGTTATMTLPGGGTQALSMMTFRSSEYTVGPSGPDAMPASLPPVSGYTYATNLRIDEAEAVGALSVAFSQSVIHYSENFLDFDPGMPVPVGFYDKELGTWIGSDDGLVIEILSINQGLAELDIGNGTPATPPQLAALGITDEERAELAGLYAPGQSLWRAPMPHFSMPDLNWPYAPANTELPPDPQKENIPQPTDKPECQPGSIIECENQVLHERVDVVGTPADLHYSSERVPGRKVKRSVSIVLTEDETPDDLGGVRLEVRVAGTIFTQTFPPDPSQEYEFTWDGLDAYGRTVYGSVPVDIRVGYTYPIVYYRSVISAQLSWGAARGAATNSVRTSAPDVTLWTAYRTRVMANDPVTEMMGGWSVTPLHYYDRDAGVIHLGNGTRRGTGVARNALQRLAGVRGQSSVTGDGGPAIEATLKQVQGLAVGADGSFCIGGGARIRCVDKDGIINTVAGDDDWEYEGEGGSPAIQAKVRDVHHLALGTDGTLYFADTGTSNMTHYVRKIDTEGGIWTIASTNGSIGGLALGPDGYVYYSVSENDCVVNRVGPDGTIAHFAGLPRVGIWPCLGSPTGNGGPAIDAAIPDPREIAFGPDGSLYVVSGERQIRRVTPDGFIEHYAGDWSCFPSSLPKIGPTNSVCISWYTGQHGLNVSNDGTVYLASAAAMRLIRDGYVHPGPGYKAWNAGQGPDPAEGAPADDAEFSGFRASFLSPDGDGLIGESQLVVWGFRDALEGGVGTVHVASEDGRELYEFDLEGRHLKTIDTLTSVTLYQFQYDTAGLIVGIQDRDGNTTTIDRDGFGKPTGIVSPYGQRTLLGTDANGFIDSVTNPNGETTGFGFGPEGLMGTMTDARGFQATFLYDPMGYLESDEDRAGGVQQLARVEGNGLLQVNHTSPLGRSTLYEVEAQSGNELERRVTNPAGDVSTTVLHTNGGYTKTYPDGTSVAYDPDGDPRFGMQSPVAEKVTIAAPGGLVRTTAVTRDVTLNDPYDPLSLTTLDETVTVSGRTFSRHYDAATSQWTLTSAAGRTAYLELDTLGRVEQTTVGGFDPVVATYDTFGRLWKLTQGTGAELREVEFSYDTLGRLEFVTDPLSQVTEFEYDDANRVESQTLPGGEVIGFTYDPNGNLQTLTPPGQPEHGFDYTPLDFESSYTAPVVSQGATVTTTQYDLDRNVKDVTRPGGEVVTFVYEPTTGRLDYVTADVGTTDVGYDPEGRLSTVTAPGGETLTYGYDGQLLMSTTWSGTVSGSVSHGYDSSFRVDSETVDVNGVADTVTYQYDGDSVMTQAGSLGVTPDPDNAFVAATSLGVVTTARDLTGFGELEYETASVLGSEIYRADYIQDKLGRIEQKTETIQGVTVVWDYEYFPSGQLKQVDKDGNLFAAYTYDDNGNRKTYAGTFGPATGSYDQQDRLTSYDNFTYTYTLAGELATKSDGIATITYAYDAFGALRTVALPNGITIDYVIDGQGRRIGKKVNGVLSQGFLYGDQLNPVAELDAQGNVSARFVYGPRSNVPAYMEKNGSTYRIITDHLGSVRLVVDTATGAVVQRIDYDEFGRVLPGYPTSGFQPFGFAGGLYDDQTGLVRFGARDYDPEIGRWTAKDPVGFRGGDADLYVYVFNDPVNSVDPSGLHSIFFDGQTVEVFDDAGNRQGTYPADSGRDGVTDPSIPFNGPIPPGEYLLYPEEISEVRGLRYWLRNRLGDWGNYRVPLHPIGDTDTLGRDGFLLHGGRKRGTMGCIDVGTNEDALFPLLQNHDGPVRVSVRYPGRG